MAFEFKAENLGVDACVGNVHTNLCKMVAPSSCYNYKCAPAEHTERMKKLHRSAGVLTQLF